MYELPMNHRIQKIQVFITTVTKVKYEETIFNSKIYK